MSAQGVSRRGFIGSAAAAVTTPWVVPATALGGSGSVAPGEQVTLGLIGVGNHGIGVNLKSFLQQRDARILAVCDVDRDRRRRAARMVNEDYGNTDCTPYRDFRRLIARDDIDAVMISTPDHWHVPMSIAAARAGKDVICEKPTLTIAEGRKLVQVVRRHGAVFQWSTEDRSIRKYRRMAELVRNGRIGELQTIRVGLPGNDTGGDPSPQPVPDRLDYDMWLGPAPWAPYTPDRCHYYFRYIYDYSGGTLTDWGAHLLDTAQWAHDTVRSGPVEADGSGTFPDEGLYNTPAPYSVTYRYADGVTMTVESGGVYLRFEGSEGWIGNEGWRGRLEASRPEILDSKFGPREVHLYSGPREHRNFLDCVKSRKDPYFPVEAGHRCFSVAHLGNISIRLGRPVRWDPAAETFVDDPAAERLTSRARREPWHL